MNNSEYVLSLFQSFREKGDSLHFSADQQCNIGTRYIMRDAVTYVMDNKPRECHATRKSNPTRACQLAHQHEL